MTLIEQIKDLINRVKNGNSVEEVQEVAEEPEQVETTDEKEDIEEAFTEALAEVIFQKKEHKKWKTNYFSKTNSLFFYEE